MEKIILYYKYIPIEHTHIIAEWQRALCQKLDLKGRIIIAPEGINGTLGGQKEALEEYKDAMNMHPLFDAIDFKESEGRRDDFPRLQVTVKKEIVRLGISPQTIPATQASPHLTPREAHEAIAKKDKNLVILDARNAYESDIGAFEGAITPNINTFRELPNFIDTHLELFQDKDVLMYCTGGVRCERASAYLASKGVARTITQISGGIHRYLEEYPEGFFKGKNFVFDGRMSLKATEDILGSCQKCQKPYDLHKPCAYTHCHGLLLLCPSCTDISDGTCSPLCSTLLSQDATKKRTPMHEAHGIRAQ